MAGPMIPYVIKDGDFLSKLAHAMGFDADQVWNDAKNDDLRKQRKKPEILCEGDVLYIPQKTVAGLPITKGSSNKFVATVPTTTFSHTFSDDSGPVANAAYTYTIDGVTQNGTTDGNGDASFEIPITSTEVQITFTDKGYTTTSKVGHLDPIEEDSGVQQRLQHLLYIKVPVGEDEALDAAILSKALSRFQTDQKLNVTGKMDDATKAKLLEVHGS